MAEKIKNEKTENLERWINQYEARKVEKKEIAYFNGHVIVF